MRRAASGLGVLAAAVGALGLAVLYAPAPTNSLASSHREAPLISEDPSADNTDLYAFRSPDNPDTLTIISNYIPGEDPAGGPNYTPSRRPPGTTSTSTGTGTGRRTSPTASSSRGRPGRSSSG